MKKIIATIVCFLLLAVNIPYAHGVCADESEAQHSHYGFDGLLEALCEIQLGSYDESVPKMTANEIIKKAFGDTPFKAEVLLNRDLVGYLATKVTSAGTDGFIKSSDFGLVDKGFRQAYLTLSNAEKLYLENGFLNSEEELTYGYLINSLCMFKNEILKNNSVSAVVGSVSNISKIDNTTRITMYNRDIGTFNVSVNNLFEKKIFKDGKCALYDRNISRDDTLTVYRNSKSEVVFLSEEGEFFPQWLNLESEYSLIRADIYYADEAFVVLKNMQTFNGIRFVKEADLYSELAYSSSVEFRYKNEIVDTEYININLLDKNAYLICDKNKNIKFIYITE